ncbi:glycoside hydrolase family 3 C-terminal domain-containing protein [Haloarcula marina]|uniref:glycoside hydrolase family 3 C-terminal domain-containing protein n=1 Tax=Haloarcula marina TaxID=2961574 RepID=UPI0020B6FE38|nr:glycoside hydrolase family 3 C-terminal domain-containing protein [Halomicroarcula marina]
MADEPNLTDGGDGSGTSRRTFMRSTGAVAAAASLFGAAGVTAAQEGTDDLGALVSEMTLEEKVRRTHGGSGGPSGIAGYLEGVERLDVPGMGMADGPTGARLGDPTTAFPHPIAVAATFDPELPARQGEAIAREVKDGDVQILLGPSMDTFRVPLHARGGETYGEDPYLSAQMAREYTSAVQSEGVVATLKHFVAYNQASTTGNVYDYFSTSEHNVVVGERALREIYCPPFREAVTEGDAGAVMPAYNRVNGTYCSEHDYLLEEILREDWGFEGFVVSDWGGTHSTVDAAVSGLDIEMPSANHFGESLASAVEADRLREGVVDRQVLRGLRSQQEIGALGGDQVGSEPARGTDEHFSLAEQMAEEGSVLLQNEGDLLPLDEDVSDVAIVGPTPTEFKEGIGGSDTVTALRRVGLTEGIEQVADDVSVTTVSTEQSELAGPDAFTPAHGNDGGDGFTRRVYANGDWSGSPTRSERVDAVELTGEERDAFDGDTVTVRWEATLTAPESGTFAFTLTSQAASSLTVDGETVVENEGGGFFGPKGEEAALTLEAGETYEIRVDAVGTAPVRLEWNRPSAIEAAVDAAADAEVAVVLARSDTFYGDDRHEFSLPGNQDEVVSQVAAANEDTVLLLNTETPVAMPWVEDVPAIMQTWFPGQEAGTAVAKLLFGEVVPSGKTPVTFAASLDDYLPGEVTSLPDEGRAYPGVDGNVFYDEGVFVGYRHFDEADIEPLFPFGHGESYADFEYGSVSLSRSTTTPEEGVTVSVDVTNTGDVAASEAVQVYVGERDPVVERPPKELKGIQKVEVPAGGTRTVEVSLGADAFQYWSTETDSWTVENGEFDVLVGASSRDIRGEATVELVGSLSEGSSDSGSDSGQSTTETETATTTPAESATDADTEAAQSTAESTTGGSGPGFTVGAALVGVAAEAVRRIRE